MVRGYVSGFGLGLVAVAGLALASALLAPSPLLPPNPPQTSQPRIAALSTAPEPPAALPPREVSAAFAPVNLVILPRPATAKAPNVAPMTRPARAPQPRRLGDAPATPEAATQVSRFAPPPILPQPAPAPVPLAPAAQHDVERPSIPRATTLHVSPEPAAPKSAPIAERGALAVQPESPLRPRASQRPAQPAARAPLTPAPLDQTQTRPQTSPPPEPSTPVQTRLEDDSNQPAYLRFAATFSRSDTRPLLSVILMDTGTPTDIARADLSALRSLRHQISVAVDATRADAGTRMMLYREMGFDVLALAQNMTPDVLQAALDALPEAVAVLQAPSGNAPDSGSVQQAFDQLLQPRGLGVVLPPHSTESTAPPPPRLHVTALADLDANDQSALVIRRFLDHGAFKAQSGTPVVMLGRLRPETLHALRAWSGQPRAALVTLAPISALLRETQISAPSSARLAEDG